jgi:hypothetical protein
MGDGSRRLLLIAMVAAVLIAGTLVSRIGSAALAPKKHPPVAAASSASQVAPLDVASAAWYCVAGAPTTLVLTSSNPKAVVATISWNGQPVVYTTIPAGGQQEVSPTTKASGPQSAEVVVLGGGVSVGQYVATRSNWSVGQCASSTSGSWYFPQGNTVAGNSVTLDVFNPAVTPAVVDIALVTQGGEQAPSAYQGIAIGAGQLLSESIDQHATNDSNVGAIVTAASGSVVAEELQYTTVGGVHGYSDQLGAPRAQSAWALPYCSWPADGSLTLNVLNPTSKAVHVTIDADYGAGTPISPVSVPIPADATASVALNQQPGFASRNIYSVLVKSDSPIVVGRVVSGKTKAVGPSSGSTMGIPGGTNRWLVTQVPAPEHAWYLAIQSLSDKALKVTVNRTLPGSGSSSSVVTEIEPGHVAYISSSVLASYVGSFIVEANGPLATELGAKSADPGTVAIPAYALP